MTTLHLDEQVLREAKAEADRLGVTLTRFIEDALCERVRGAASSFSGRSAEIAERDRLMQALLTATAHFRVGERPTRRELHERC